MCTVKEEAPLKALLARIVDSSLFQNFITGVILFAGVLVGLETYPSIVQSHGPLLHVLDAAVLWIFVAEIVLKMGALGSRPHHYFRDPWNVFDFVIVAVCFLPLAGQYALILRLVRLLRVLRLVHVLPRLQVLVSALLKSIPSMGYISLFLALLFYLYAVTAVFLFGKNDPLHFQDIPRALLTLFQIVTLEGWVDVMQINMKGCAAVEFYKGAGQEKLCTHSQGHGLAAPLFFISFILIGTMVILNLFIGVIMNSMEESHAEMEEQKETQRMAERGLDSHSLEHLLYELSGRIQALQSEVAHIQRVAGERGWTGTGTVTGPGGNPLT